MAESKAFTLDVILMTGCRLVKWSGLICHSSNFLHELLLIVSRHCQHKQSTMIEEPTESAACVEDQISKIPFDEVAIAA